jgi:hypothetical protein
MDEERTELEPEELERLEGENLPDREAMSVLTTSGTPLIHQLPAVEPEQFRDPEV